MQYKLNTETCVRSLVSLHFTGEEINMPMYVCMYVLQYFGNLLHSLMRLIKQQR
jgi:hypothetical protein